MALLDWFKWSSPKDPSPVEKEFLRKKAEKEAMEKVNREIARAREDMENRKTMGDWDDWDEVKKVDIKSK